MYPTKQEKSAIEIAEKLMSDTMARYDPSHDGYHVQRVRKTALEIANALPTKPDLLVVEIAALLHDVLDKKYVSAEQATDPESFFLPLFKRIRSDTGLDLITDGRGRQIAKIVDNVSWTTEKKLRENGQWTTSWHDSCVELHCVQDADRLDAIGAFGILRCAAFSAITNRPLYVPLEEDPNRVASAVQHFHDKLLFIRDRLKTKPGQDLGESRHQMLLVFLSALENEWNGIDYNPGSSAPSNAPKIDE